MDLQQVLYLGSDSSLQRELMFLLADHGLSVQRYPTVAGIVASAQDQVPAALLLDMHVLPAGRGEQGLAERLESLTGRRPAVVCLAPSLDVESRLSALYQGAAACLPHGAPADAVAARILAAIRSEARRPVRVLIVDDVRMEARVTARMLGSVGMQTEYVTDPFSLIEAMERFSPDVVLMDLYMPNADGAELTAIIRNHEEHSGVPVIILSAEKDPHKQRQALLQGADDFLSKPIHREQLVAAIEHRLRRSREIAGRKGRGARDLPGSDLQNRHRFLQQLDRAIMESTGAVPGRGLLYIEPDGLGGEAGSEGTHEADAVRAHISRILHEHMAPWDLAERIAELGFALYVQRLDAATLAQTAEDLRRAIAARAVDYGDQTRPITVSIGVGRLRPSGDDALALLSRAQKALREARERGGDRVQDTVGFLGEPAREEPATRLSKLMRQALAGQGFELFYQPIVSLRGSSDTDFDVLLRLKTPDGEHLHPPAFLAAAEEAGMMGQIDRWVMEHALEVMRRERARRRRLRLFVRQSAASLGAPHWSDWLREQIAARDMIKHRPVVQLQMQDVRACGSMAKAQLEALRRLAIPVCLANLDRAEDLDLLRRLPIAIVKLSHESIADGADERFEELVAGIRRNGVRVLAAGIESAETARRAWAGDVDYIQGNFIQFPRETPQFEPDFPAPA